MRPSAAQSGFTTSSAPRSPPAPAPPPATPSPGTSTADWPTTGSPRLPPRISTVDLAGDGLTVLAGPGDPRWAGAKDNYRGSVPLTVHLLDAQTVDALELRPGGAMLVRPDGREAGRWPGYDAWLRSGRPGLLAGRPATSPAAPAPAIQ